MHKIWQWLLLAVTGLALMVFSPPIAGHAQTITSVTGLDANSAVIKDSQGKIYSHTQDLPSSQAFTVNYRWRIPNSTSIRSGDTMNFYIPDNVQITKSETFSMTSTTGIGTIGTATVTAGSHQGTVTLNRALQYDTLNRNGFISLDVKGATPTTPPTTNTPVSMTKQVSWTNPNDFTKITWLLAIDLHGQTVKNPTIVDQLSNNQQYIAKSACATNTNGNKIPITATSSGSQVTFKLTGTFKNNFSINYRTTTDASSGAATFTNAAVYHDDNGNNAAANATISRDDEELEPDEDEDPDVTPPTTNPSEPEEPEPPVATDPIKLTKSVSWVDPGDYYTKLNWRITIAANGHKLVNPEIVDKLSSNQSFIPGSGKVTDGSGQVIPVTESHSGTQVVFQLTGTFTHDLYLTYQSAPDNPTGRETFDNAAVYHDDNGNHASGSATIDRPGDVVDPDVPGQDDPITMTKTAAWSEANDFTKINWSLMIAANGNRLVNPQIVDQLSNNQTYLDGTVIATDANGKNIPVTSSVQGHQITFKLTGTFTTNLKISYQTKTTSPSGAAVFDNAALYQDDSGNQAAADADIARDEELVTPEEPNKEAISLHKSATWVDQDDKTKILWTITVDNNGNELINPRITDDYGTGLTYIENSAKAVDSSGNTIPLNVIVNDHQLIFTLTGTYNTNLTITYQTKTVTPTGAATYANAAVYVDDNDNDASASANIERPKEPGTSEPGNPGKPGTSEPGNPGKPGTSQPSNPGKPGTSEPSNPSKPGTSEPGNPGKPGTSEPSNPGKPGTSEPSNPSKPGTSEPSNPGKPGTSTSEGPSSTIPSTSNGTNNPINSTQPSVGSTATAPSTNITPTGTGTSFTSTNTPENQTLPQTDEAHRTVMQVAGLLLLVIATLIGFIIYRRHRV